ncbi:MAG: ribbon-helix-helix protein, CopG family [Mycobacterium sp.]
MKGWPRVGVPHDLYDEIRELAKQQDRSQAMIVRRAITDYREKSNREAQLLAGDHST